MKSKGIQREVRGFEGDNSTHVFQGGCCVRGQDVVNTPDERKGRENKNS